jgi:hypothetical protein
MTSVPRSTGTAGGTRSSPSFLYHKSSEQLPREKWRFIEMNAIELNQLCNHLWESANICRRRRRKTRFWYHRHVGDLHTSSCCRPGHHLPRPCPWLLAQDAVRRGFHRRNCALRAFRAIGELLKRRDLAGKPPETPVPLGSPENPTQHEHSVSPVAADPSLTTSDELACVDLAWQEAVPRRSRPPATQTAARLLTNVDLLHAVEDLRTASGKYGESYVRETVPR